MSQAGVRERTVPGVPATAGKPGKVGRSGGAGRWREGFAGWFFVAPNLALLAVFLFIPLFAAFKLSFEKASTFGPATWVGLENYRTLLADDVFWRVLLNTVVFTVVTVPTSIVIGLVLATLLNKAMPGRAVFRTIIYLPIVISGLVTSMIGLLMFDEGVGVLNGILHAMGIGAVHWQTDGTLAMISVILMTLWTRVGFAMVIYLAGLQDIPSDVYEAADLDGASGWQTFLRVTTPMLSGSTLFLIVMNMIWSFQIFDIVYVMTNGGPGYDTSMLVLYAYDQGFGPTRDFGYGSTIGVVLFLITLVLAIFQIRRTEKRT